MRVVLYNAYHEVLPLRKLSNKFTERYNIRGPVCESSDVFAFSRMLPIMKAEELLQYWMLKLTVYRWQATTTFVLFQELL